MSQYATLDNYIEWLSGRAATIPSEEFLFWSSRATQRINKKRVELEEIPDYLIACTCEVAEILFKDNQTRQLDALKSMSIGSYSESYADQKQETKELRKTIDGIIIDNLALTSLHDDFVFRGAR